MKLNEVKKVDLMNSTLENEIISQLYLLAWSFVHKHHVIGYEDEDFVQELVIHSWNKRHLFNEEKANFTTFSMFCWLNLFKIHLRRKKSKENKMIVTSYDKEIFDNIDLLDTIPDENENISENLIKKERYDFVLSRCGKVLKLYLFGYKQKEISKKLNISQPHVSRKIKRQLEEFRIDLKEGVI